MKTIKFSHVYNKMLDAGYHIWSGMGEKTILLEVFIADSKDFSMKFVKYDTAYMKSMADMEYSYYGLPRGKVIVLLLKTDKSLWTTIRRYTPEKHEYYMQARGEEFKIEITGDDE